MPNEPRQILALETSPFCRSLAVVPALRSLKTAYPNAYVVAAACRGACEIIVAASLADETLDLGMIDPVSQNLGPAVKRLIRMLRLTRRRSFDLAVDFSSALETQISLRFGLTSRVISRARAPHLVELLIGAAKGGRRIEDHRSDCEQVLRQLGLDLGEQRSAFTLPVEENQRFELLLARHGSKGGEPIVIFYGSGATIGRGSPAVWLNEVAVRLVNNFGARIIAVDDPYSRAFTSSIAGTLPRGSILLASPRALEVAASIARASLVVSDEGELSNLTSSFQTPLLEIRNAGGRSVPSRADRVVFGSAGRRLADDVFEAACEMIQASRLPSLFQR